MKEPKDNTYLFSVGDTIRYAGRQGTVLDKWWDALGNRYEIKLRTGNWVVKEKNLELIKKKQNEV